MMNKAGAIIGRSKESTNVIDEYVQGFFDKVHATSVRDGLNILMQLAGLGVLRPNVVVIGFKDDWMCTQKRMTSCPSDSQGRKTDDGELNQYFGMIKDIINARMGIIIVRNMQNFDWGISGQYNFDFDKGIGTVDIWWLNDDGGLTALVAELLTTHAIFRTSKRKRLMVVVESELQWTEPLLVMSQMIKKFRLNLEIVPVQTEGLGPAKKNLGLFESIAGKQITSFEKPKVTSRFIRVGELMRQWSKTAKLCIVTLPTPKNCRNAVEYIATMEWLSMMLPPTILMRGADQNVLTYYL